MEAGAAPKANSPFGASQLWTKPDEALIPHTEVFYIGSPDNILGVNWRHGFSRGLSNSVNEGKYTLSNTSTQMTAYWSSTIPQASSGDATGWKGPEKDTMFEGADNPTHLACMTASSTKAPEVPLMASHDLSHYFFQVKRQLKHVYFDGRKLSGTGFVPMP
ncbi:hypothetical protein CT0861_09148 [Colletotrichum tofieldiae]|uniref:Uncharacterized protein n=1 Tax=Colletotrichum tofieldiae TaxID=708197 RepID=A0A161VS95_9PEZI|nr:hypothetical protein CT0861_09148 [Colletotrichum tofieldiae]